MPPPDSRHGAGGSRAAQDLVVDSKALQGAGARDSWRTLSGATDRDRARAARDALADTFFAHFLRAPALVGGIVPSSRVLARAMSRHATGYDAIVELGAGGGSITRWLAADHPRAALTVSERSPEMARRLARAWPRAHVHHGCVHERAECLESLPARTVAVSSLPFRSLPADLAHATIAVIERFLLGHRGRSLVQYSYGLREPFAFGSTALAWRRAERVWRNVPPAIVWIAEQAVEGR